MENGQDQHLPVKVSLLSLIKLCNDTVISNKLASITPPPSYHAFYNTLIIYCTCAFYYCEYTLSEGQVHVHIVQYYSCLG